ncbi:uncharacterized protein CMC5_009190 [Chondromyces crocatus]|uniref:Uncharacterized protein n=2 Tax=Chondromyces crocatus TaxID=52 RepID=A0A0K1E886_CHOCO|nr:uncharacterized protein CMC5_009190 [Chondromyces crocatus]
MRTMPLLVASSLALAALVTAPRAEACSPALGVHGTLPTTSAEQWPTNLPIHLFSVLDITLDEAGVPLYSVLVDGQPATLVEAAQAQRSRAGGLQVVVEPPPIPGQQVLLSGTFCPASQGCPPVNLAFVAAPPDVEGPTESPALWFDLYDHKDDDAAVGSCVDLGAFTVTLHVDGSPQPEDASPLMYTIQAFTDASLTNAVGSWRRITQGGSESFYISGAPELVVPQLADAYCFRVDIEDLAGNDGVSSSVTCKPCRYRADPDSPFSLIDFNEAALYPGGQCADWINPIDDDFQHHPGPGVTPEAQSTTSGGCQLVVAANSSHVGLLLGALSLLALLSRRRHPGS